MGVMSGAPINEAVYLIKSFDSTQLSLLLNTYPKLARELNGMEGGGSTATDLDKDRARVMIAALEIGQSQAQNVLLAVRVRMDKAKRRRLGSQIITLLASSGVIAAVVSLQQRLALLTALFTFLAALTSLTADHLEALFRPGSGSSYQVFESASALVYKAGSMRSEIALLLKHDADASAVSEAVSLANSTCEELNKLCIQLGGNLQRVGTPV